MKLNKEQDKIKEEDVDDGTVRMLPDGTLYSVYDPKPIQAFVGLADTLKQPLINLQGNIDSFQKAVQNIISPVVDLRKTIFEQFVEPIRVADNFGKTVFPQYLQSVSVMQDLLKSTQDSIKVFNDLVVTDFPLKNSFVSIDPSTVLDFGVKSAKIDDTLYGTISFASVAHQRSSIGILEFETTQSLVVKVDRLEAKVDSIQTKLFDEMYPFLIEDSKHIDDMLTDILAFYKGKPQSFAKVTKIEFNNRTSELKINSVSIPLQPDSNEEELCRVLFKNENSIKRHWEMSKIAETMRITQDSETTKLWSKKLYQTARQLGQKIAIKTGIKDFIVYTTKSIDINPKYIKSK